MEMEGLVTRLVEAREACLTKSIAPPAIEVGIAVVEIMDTSGFSSFFIFFVLCFHIVGFSWSRLCWRF